MNIKGEVRLPASKSISNRVLIIHALADCHMPISNLADCDDTNVMSRVLQSDGCNFDVGYAGTAMRFLTAFLSQVVGKWEITGSERMKQRPISVLIEALHQLGAKVEYAGIPGYPPLRIYGSYLAGGEIQMPASVSSQYVSALLMIAPYMDKGLKLHLQGKVVSPTYINMTLQIMRIFGADVEWKGNIIRVAPKSYVSAPYWVENDWSAASYFYELLAIAGEGELFLPGLEQNSMQGDAGQVALWEQMGIITRYVPDGIVIHKVPVEISLLEYDFVGMPDLVQSFAVACCLQNIPFVFRGVETLRIKETDRIRALMNELAKLGYCLKVEDSQVLKWDGTRQEAESSPKIATYHDHRMAMAFAPAVLKHPDMDVVDKNVVSKSFPGYWGELQKICRFS